MELPFEKTVCRYWKQKLYTLHNQEQTQEFRIPEGMPDVGRVISAWGQMVLRGKDWNDRNIGIQGGIMVWVLYQPEGNDGLQRLETWIPFRSRVDLPAGDGEGTIRVQCVLRDVDTRILSTRKLMLRCGIGLLVQALVPAQAEVSVPGDIPEDVEVLRNTYPMMLTVETGEKSFLVDEELEVPGVMSPVKSLVYFQLEPELADQKVIGSKALFHGIANLHVLYWNEEERLCCHDFQIPFGQYLDLEGDYQEEAQIRNLLCVTSLELDVEEDGILHLRCGLVSQYMVQDRSVLDLIEDAYSPCRDVEMTYDTLTLPAILDTVMYTMELSAKISEQESSVADCNFQPGLPEVRQQADRLQITQDGTFQALEEHNGLWQSRMSKAAGDREVKSHCTCDTVAFSWRKGSVGIRREGMDWRAETQMVIDLSSVSTNSIPMVTAMKLGQQRAPEANQPGVILRRKGKDERLWDLAKRCGSTVSAIEKINALELEPEEDRLLLIPVL